MAAGHQIIIIYRTLCLYVRLHIIVYRFIRVNNNLVNYYINRAKITDKSYHYKICNPTHKVGLFFRVYFKGSFSKLLGFPQLKNC